MLKVNLSLVTRRRRKQVCRVCREIARLEADSLCRDCAWVKAQIRSRIPGQLPRYTPPVDADASGPGPQCARPRCLCAACGGRTLDVHPLHPSDPARTYRRDIHFHPRCHELYLEAAG